MKSFTLIIFCMLVLSGSPVNASENISENPFTQIDNQVVKSVKSLNFPAPKFKEIGTVAFVQDKPTSVTYGHYRVDDTSMGLTRISTAATQTFETRDMAYNLFLRGFLDEGRTLEHELRSSGTGVSAGGIIEVLGQTQMNMKTSNNIKFLPASFSHSMSIESKITKLEIVSGHLFPLEVGNKLVIKRTSESSMEKGMERTATLEFQVTKQIEGYLLNNTELPGNVFEITIHSEQSKKGLSQPATFLFSSHLGWVVESHIGNNTERAVGWN